MNNFLRRFGLVSLIVLLANTVLSAPDDLANAAQQGDQAKVAALLELPETLIDSSTPGGMTALLWAAQANDLAMLKTLLEAGANANLANRYGITALWLAAINHNAPMVALLLEFNADPGFVMPHGETALMIAARAGDAESINLLLAAGADPNASETTQGETALMWAAAENHPDAIRALIAGGADPDAHASLLDLAPMKWLQVGMVSTTLPVGGWTAAMYAARQNSIASILALQESGANLDAQNQGGATALLLAIMNAHYDLAAALIHAGANPAIGDQTGMNALYLAVDMVSFSKDIGRPLVPQFDTLTASDLVKIMLANGVDPNAVLTSRVIGRHHGFGDFELGAGATALMRAAKNNDLESMRVLLEAGADPDLALENGLTVIDLVTGKGRSPANEEARVLLQEFAGNKR